MIDYCRTSCSQFSTFLRPIGTCLLSNSRIFQNRAITLNADNAALQYDQTLNTALLAEIEVLHWRRHLTHNCAAVRVSLLVLLVLWASYPHFFHIFRYKCLKQPEFRYLRYIRIRSPCPWFHTNNSSS